MSTTPKNQATTGLHSVLSCEPTYFVVRQEHNPYMKKGTPVDLKQARKQWEDIRYCFREAGFKIETIPAVPELEDMVFSAHQALVGNHPKIGPFVVPSRMRFESRQREVPYYVDWFKRRNYTVLELDYGEDYLEAGGDCIWCADFSKIWAGYGFRSTKGGVEKLAARMQELNIEVVPLELVDKHFFHLDMSFTVLSKDAVMLYPGAFSAQSLKTIRERIKRVHEVTKEQAMQFVCTGVAANGRFIGAHLTPELKRMLESEGLEPIAVNTSEFEKSGASVCSIKQFIV